MENTKHGIRINATAPRHRCPPRRVPRNQNAVEQTAQEKEWYQGVIDQTIDSSLMHRYGTIDEQVAPILFFASDSLPTSPGRSCPSVAATSAKIKTPKTSLPPHKSFITNN